MNRSAPLSFLCLHMTQPVRDLATLIVKDVHALSLHDAIERVGDALLDQRRLCRLAVCPQCAAGVPVVPSNDSYWHGEIGVAGECLAKEIRKLT